MDRISDFKSRVSAQSTDWRKRLREKLRAIKARKVTPMEDQEQYAGTNAEPKQDQEATEEEAAEAKYLVFAGEVYEVVSLGWGIRHGGSIIVTGPKTEMTKQARANAREDGAELHIFNTAGKVTRKEYF